MIEVHGHHQALETLRRLRSSSLMLVGPEGVGRRRVARWLAAELNCLAEDAARPCGVCDSCVRFASDHPDYREVAPRGTTASGRRSSRPEIVIGQLVPRQGSSEDPLSRWLEQRPAFRRRVGVIDGAERLTQAAANSFLKMLEEPPSYATIVLIAPSPQAVLPTIASRCAIVRLGVVDTSELPLASHPAHRLGRPGPLLQPPPKVDEAVAAVEGFVSSLDGDLADSLAGADELARLWQDPEGGDVAELLRGRLAQLPARLFASSDDRVLACEEAISGYSPATLALRVLALELRALLRGAPLPSN